MIGILGAGSLGRLWAALLPQGQTTVLPRPERAPASSFLTYTFNPIEGSPRTIRVPYCASPSELGLLLVMTKAGDVLAALDAWLPRIPAQIPVVLFQNGLGSQQRVASAWPCRPILAAATTEGANCPQPDRLIHAGTGATWVGALNEAGRAHVEPAVRALAGTGLTVHNEPDILGRLWQKLVINAGINPFTALLDCPNGAILTSALYRQHIDSLCQELGRLLAAEGIETAAASALRARIETVARATARNTSSMRSDLLNGRTTEIDFINGYLVRLGQHHGIPTPVNQMLTERVKQLSHH